MFCKSKLYAFSDFLYTCNNWVGYFITLLSLSINYFLILWWLWNKDSSSFYLLVCRETRPTIHGIISGRFSSMFTNSKMKSSSWWWRESYHRIPNDFRGWHWEGQCEYYWSWYNKSHFWESGERYQLRSENVCKECCVWIYQANVYFFFQKDMEIKYINLGYSVASDSV